MFESTIHLSVIQIPLAIIAFLSAGLLLSLSLFKKPDGSWFLEHLSSAFLIGLIVYKGWILVDNPRIILEHPLHLLSYNGGSYGWEAAWVISLSWLLYIFLQSANRPQLWKYIRWTLVGWILWQITQSLLIKEYGSMSSWGWTIKGQSYLPLNLIWLLTYLLLLGIGVWLGRHTSLSLPKQVGILLVSISTNELLLRGLKPVLTLVWGPYGWIDFLWMLSLFVGLVIWMWKPASPVLE